jgi:hypothetical protein
MLTKKSNYFGLPMYYPRRRGLGMKSIQLKKSASIVSVVFALVLTMGISANAEMKVNGFVDAQYGWDNDGKPLGFTLNDGAVYLNASGDMAYAMVDLAFSGGNSTTSAAFTFASGKSQAYVGKKYDMGLSWQLGQWDTIWGLEGNDTKDLFFAKQGRIYSSITPFVHMGALLGYKFTEMLSLNVIVADAQDTSIGQSQTGNTGTNYNYAGQLMYKGDGFWFKGGYSFQTAGADTSLIDVSLGLKAGSLDVSAGFDMADVGATDNEMGFIGNFLYTASDTLGYGLRFEYVSKLDVGTNPADTGIYLTGGLNHKATKDLTGKLNYTFSSITAVTGGTSTTGHAIDLAAVYSF